LETIISVANRTLSDHNAVLSSPAVKRESGQVNVRDGVAILNVGGVIMPKADLFTEISGGTTVDTLALRFNEALEAKDVKAIVLHIDSPGGSITGVHEFSNQIYDARGKKPIISYISSLGASAAYWIGSAADKIIVDKTARIGSIGVVASWSDNRKAREKAGITDYEIVSNQTPNKRLDATTDEGKKVLQDELDGLANIFIENVARNRDTNSIFVQENYGKGGVLLADDAIKVGMVDSLGSLESVINSFSEGESFMSDVMAERKVTSIVASAKMAEDDTPEEEEGKARQTEDDTPEEGEDGKAQNKKKAALLASNPKLYNAIKTEGVLEERERIKAIENMADGYDGFENLVNSAKYDNPITAEKLAVKIVTAGKVAKEDYSAKLKADAEAINGVPVSVSSDSSNDDDFISAIVGKKDKELRDVK
jgi:signal peptide peptidase SppA